MSRPILRFQSGGSFGSEESARLRALEQREDGRAGEAIEQLRVHRNDLWAVDEYQTLARNAPGLAGILARIALRSLTSSREQAERLEAERGALTLAKTLDSCEVPEAIARQIVRGEVEETAPLALLRERLEAGQLTVVLAGVAGTGKTLAACTVLGRRGGYFLPAERYCGMKPDWYEDRQTIAYYQRDLRVLVLDDLGAAAGKTSAIEPLLTRRHDNGVLTLLTLNVPHAAGRDRTPEVRRAVAEIVGDRVLSRLKEKGSVLVMDEVLRGKKEAQA